MELREVFQDTVLMFGNLQEVAARSIRANAPTTRPDIKCLLIGNIPTGRLIVDGNIPHW